MNPWQQQPGPPAWGPPPGQYPAGAPLGGYPAPTPYGQPPPGYPPQRGLYPPQPSGSTAIAAAILSFLGGAAHALNAMGAVAGVARQWSHITGVSSVLLAIFALVMVAAVVGLVVGGIMLLRRQLSGRIVIVVSCAVIIVLQIIVFASTATMLRSYGLSAGLYGGSGLVVHVVMAGVTITLALASPTRQWCLAGRPSLPPATPW